MSGCLLGAAIGDALGLPLEGLSPQRARKLFGAIDDDFSMRLWLGRGLVSDDTEHAILTLQAFVSARGVAREFEHELARYLKFWFLKLPPGVGLATAKACLKLLLGFPPARSGIFSAGNGPAMRAPILGVVCRDDEQLRDLVKIATRITHTDPKAETGALAIAFASRCASTRGETSPRDFLCDLQAFLKNEDSGSADLLGELCGRVVESVERGESTPDFAASLGLSKGVSGYIYHTAPIVLHAWLCHPNDYRAGVLACLRCGGDADSVAAICGGVIGARVGTNHIPHQWVSALIERPRDIRWMHELATRAAHSETMSFRVTDIFIPARNVFLLGIVLWHGLRRLLPPY